MIGLYNEKNYCNQSLPIEPKSKSISKVILKYIKYESLKMIILLMFIRD